MRRGPGWINFDPAANRLHGPHVGPDPLFLSSLESKHEYFEQPTQSDELVESRYHVMGNVCQMRKALTCCVC